MTARRQERKDGRKDGERSAARPSSAGSSPGWRGGGDHHRRGARRRRPGRPRRCFPRCRTSPSGSRWCCGSSCLALPLAIAIAAVARLRFVSPADIGGAAFSAASRRVTVANAILGNTLEQTMLALVVHLGLAAVLPVAEIAIVPVAAALFLLGRLGFALGYAVRARGRSASRSPSTRRSRGSAGECGARSAEPPARTVLAETPVSSPAQLSSSQPTLGSPGYEALPVPLEKFRPRRHDA
ncbi:MAPEG family protein [Sphingomonas sp. MMS24-JH45]